MSPIRIEKVRPGEEPEPRVYAELERLFDDVRNRAFAIFRDRGQASGAALEDWLRAEREILGMPAAELTENDKEFHLRIAAPGMSASDVKVTAMPRALLVEGAAIETREQPGNRLVFCEFSNRRFLRKVDLAHEIDPEKVRAFLDKGVLDITAARRSGVPDVDKPVAVKVAA